MRDSMRGMVTPTDPTELEPVTPAQTTFFKDVIFWTVVLLAVLLTLVASFRLAYRRSRRWDGPGAVWRHWIYEGVKTR